MNNFLELTKMERIEVMRLAVETLAIIKKRPKYKGDVIREVKAIAETYSAYLVQKQKIETEQPVVAELKYCDCSSDLVASLYARQGNGNDPLFQPARFCADTV